MTWHLKNLNFFLQNAHIKGNFNFFLEMTKIIALNLPRTPMTKVSELIGKWVIRKVHREINLINPFVLLYGPNGMRIEHEDMAYTDKPVFIVDVVDGNIVAVTQTDIFFASFGDVLEYPSILNGSFSFTGTYLDDDWRQVDLHEFIDDKKIPFILEKTAVVVEMYKKTGMVQTGDYNKKGPILKKIKSM